MDWYYLKNGRTLGPVPEQSIRAWLGSGFLSPQDLLWRSGMTEWTPVAELAEFGSGTASTGRFPGTAPGSLFSAAMLPPPAGVAGYAGFWLRLGAYLFDSLVLAIILTIAWFPKVSKMTDPMDFQKDPALLAIAFALSWVYYTAFEGSPLQATPGKRLFHLRVTDMDGHRIGFLRAGFRQLFKVISGVLLYLGFVAAGFTPRRQALHDLIARCLVIRA